MTSLGKYLPMLFFFVSEGKKTLKQIRPTIHMRTIPHFNVFFPQNPQIQVPASSSCPSLNLFRDVYHLESLRVCPYVCVCQQMLLHSPPGQAPASTECVMWLPGQSRPVGIGNYAEPSRRVGANKSRAASSDYRPRLS